VLQVHSFLASTRANGPGKRCCLWLQGCSLGCDGCFNPETHAVSGGKGHAVDEVFQWISQAPGIEGLTISGGEPLQQRHELLELLELVRSKTDLSVLLFTGFAVCELEKMGCLSQLERLVDVLIAGRFVADESLKSGLIGSSNKTVHYFSERYTDADLNQVPVAEAIISAEGEISLSGIDPLILR
jgi:anaerobic ribonucleoside-triphosphate reductase activating protein